MNTLSNTNTPTSSPALAIILKVVKRVLHPASLVRNAKLLAASLWLYLSFKSHRLSLITVLGLPFIAWHVEKTYPRAEAEIRLDQAKSNIMSVLDSLSKTEEEIIQLRASLEQKVELSRVQIEEAESNKVSAIAEANEKIAEAENNSALAKAEAFAALEAKVALQERVRDLENEIAVLRTAIQPVKADLRHTAQPLTVVKKTVSDILQSDENQPRVGAVDKVGEL